MKGWEIIIIWGLTCLTVLAIAYWYLIRQDGTVLLTLSSVIGGAIGWIIRSRFPVYQPPEPGRPGGV